MKDTSARFGWLSVLFHWTLVFSFIGLLGSGWYMLTLSYYDPWYTRLPHIHKSVGMILILVFACHLAWRALNRRPDALATHRSWETVVAGLTQWTMRLGVVAILVTGYLIPTSQGEGISVFGWFEIPALVTDLPGQSDTAGLIHKYVAWAIGILALMHAGAALKHHFIDRDETLTRMMGINRRKPQ